MHAGRISGSRPPSSPRRIGSRYLGDPATTRIPVEELLDDARIGRLAATIDPHRAARPPDATLPPGGGTVSSARSMRTATPSASSSPTTTGLARVSPIRRPGSCTRTAARSFSLVPAHANVLAPRKADRSTRCSPGCCSVTASAGPWLVVGSMGADAQPQIHAQFVVRCRRRWRRHRHGGRGAALVRRARRSTSTPPIDVLTRAAHRARSVVRALEAMGHPVVPTAPFDSIGWATSTRSSWSTAGRRVPAGPARQRRTRAARAPATW